MMEVALGIDVGLTGARAALVSPEGIVVARSRPTDTEAAHGAEQDPREWPNSVSKAVRATLDQVSSAGPEIVVIAVAAAGCQPILVDSRLEPLTPAMLVALDLRPGAERARLERERGLPAGALLDGAIPTLLWLREHAPEAFERAAYVLDATGLLVAGLTGESTMDVITAEDYALPGLEAPLPIPALRDPLEIAGGLTTAAAHELGIDAGIPVTVGTYDSYVDLHSMAGGEGAGSILLGSTMVVGADARADTDSGTAGLRVTPLPGNRRMLGGWTSAAGATIRWAQAQFGAADIERVDPGAGGLLALPYLNGERTPIWDRQARGLIVGLTTETSAAELYRALVDSVVLSARDIVERMREHSPLPGRWRVAGGGIHDSAWLQATSDALGAPLDVVDITGGVGAAVFALHAIGHEPVVPVVRSVTPDPARTERFDALYPIYRDLYPRVAGTIRRLASLE